MLNSQLSIPFSDHCMQLDHNVGIHAADFSPTKFFTLELSRLARDIVVYAAKYSPVCIKNDRYLEIDKRSFQLFTRQPQRIWEKYDSSNKKGKIDLPIPEDDYDWVNNKFEYALYLLNKIPLTETIKIKSEDGRTTWGHKSYLVIDSLIVIQDKNRQKRYGLKVNDTFLQRTLKDYWFKPEHYSLISTKHRNLYLALLSSQARTYFKGELSDTFTTDQLAKIMGTKTYKERKYNTKSTVIAKIKEFHLHCLDKKIPSPFKEFVECKLSESWNYNYAIRFEYPFDEIVIKSFFNYKNNTDFMTQYNRKLKKWYSLYVEISKEKDFKPKPIENWKKLNHKFDNLYKHKIQAFIDVFKTVYNKDVTKFPKILEKEFSHPVNLQFNRIELGTPTSQKLSRV